ncbi:MAG: hypothetical protein H6R07_740 [Proteobacteria bacterium]|nr:hypothetical protein [Pseudomonadota bacterium]
MHIVVTLPSRLVETVSHRIHAIPAKICKITLAAIDAGDTPPAVKPGDGLLVLQPNDFHLAQIAATRLTQDGIHYAEAALIESPQAAQYGFMALVGGKAADLHALASVLNCLAPCSYGWWHVGGAGSAAFLLALLNRLGHTLQTPIDLSCLLPQLAQLVQTQQQSGSFAAEYLAASSDEHFSAALPERQRALACFLDQHESPARQIAQMISVFQPQR